MNKEKLDQLGANFNSFVKPLLDSDDPEDYHFLWEFEKLFHSKKLRVLTAKNEAVKKWKAMLLSK